MRRYYCLLVCNKVGFLDIDDSDRGAGGTQP